MAHGKRRVRRESMEMSFAVRLKGRSSKDGKGANAEISESLSVYSPRPRRKRSGGMVSRWSCKRARHWTINRVDRPYPR